MSAKELAAVTRIAPRLVDSLEADRYGDFPAEVFIRGFLRNCARELRLDADELVSLYERHSGRPAPPRLADELADNDPAVEALFDTRRWPRASYIIAIIAIILGLGLSLLIFGDSEPERLSDHRPDWQQIDR